MDLTLSSVSIERVPLILHEPYTIAYQTVEAVENIFIKIHFTDGFTATGVAAPEVAVTGETIDSTEALYNNTLCERILQCKTLQQLVSSFPALQDEFCHFPAALAGIDFCIIAACALSESKSVGQYLSVKGADLRSLPTTITVNIHPEAETIVKVKKWLSAGFTMVKIKGGLSVEDDLRKLFLLRREFPTSLPILFDANQGYSQEEAEYFLKTARKLSLIAVEQPVSALDPDLLLSLAGKQSIPIMADESACSLTEVTYLAKRGLQYFNVKLMKCGGTRKAFELAREIVSYDRKMIFSCMDECALSNAFSLVTALAIPQVQFVDLDSFTDYSHDPTREYIDLHKGRISTRL